jgi:hypothetical protein
MKKFTQTDLNETEGLYDSRQDRWSRRAKRHFSQAELRNLENAGRIFEERETVIYQNTEVKVKIPEGPRQTVGILFEGKLRMVAKSDLTKLDEMVMGMTSLSPINRMMQLAGVEPKEIISEDETDDDILRKRILEKVMYAQRIHSQDMGKTQLNTIKVDLNWHELDLLYKLLSSK